MIYILCLLILAITHTRISLFEDIDVGGCELSRADAALEEEIEFGKGATLRLRHAEVRVDDTEEADPGLLHMLESMSGGCKITHPEEACEVAPIPCTRV
jgi:hypothetical protein